MNIIIPAPEPFTLPNIRTARLSGELPAINGSQTLSIINPPKKEPIGIVKNWNVLRQE